MAEHDYTNAERQRMFHRVRKAAGLKQVREYVPADLAPELKRIAAEMRDPKTAIAYRQRMKNNKADKSETDD